MKRILASRRKLIILGAGGLIAAPSIVRAGSLSLLGVGTPPAAAPAGVVFDAITHGTPVTSAAGISWTHTPSGTPSGVAVIIAGYNAGTFVTACTYGGVSMTATARNPPATISVATNILFSLANPPAGPQTVAASGAIGAFLAGAAITVTGSDLVTCFRNSTVTSAGTGASTSTTVTSAVGDLVIDVANGFQAGAAASGPGGSQTSRYTDFWNGNLSIGVSTSSGGASVTDTWTTVNTGGTQTWAASNASIKHA